MPAGASPLLWVENLRVQFGGKAVVHGVDFHLNAGEKLALVGESGSGKTVTALSLLRLLEAAQLQGRALFRGENLLELSGQRLRQVRGGEIAVVFQEPMTALNPLMTIGQQIAEVVQLKQGRAAQPRGRRPLSCWRRRASLSQPDGPNTTHTS